MADSADDLLARARQAMTDDLYALGAGGAYVELKDAVTELDALLSAGGPMPAAWADCGPTLGQHNLLKGRIGALEDANADLHASKDRVTDALREARAEVARLAAELDAARDVILGSLVKLGMDARPPSEGA